MMTNVLLLSRIVLPYFLVFKVTKTQATLLISFVFPLALHTEIRPKVQQVFL